MFGNYQRKLRSLMIKLKLLRFAVDAALRPRKRLFIDCGSNLGQGYTFFKRYLRPRAYDALLIEPNPNCMQVLRKKFGGYSNLEFLQAAAWIDQGTMKLYGLVEDSRGATSTGASIVSRHNSSMYDSDEAQAAEVDTFSLARLVLDKSQSYDQLIVKLDIESAEYEVLTDLIRKGAATHIQHLFIEFHSQYFTAPDRQRYQQMEADLAQELKGLGVGVSLWF